LLPGPFGALRSVARVRGIELDPVERRLRSAASVADLRRIARRRLPGGVFDYIDGGAEDERSLRRNAEAFADFSFRPRVLTGLADVDPSTTLLGKQTAMPVVLAPTGFTRIAHPDGELAVARAAARAGIPYALSTLGTRSIEEVARVSCGRLWFQVYIWRDRDLVRQMIERADAAGYEALVLTVDTPVLGRRERDVRRGFSLPPTVGVGTLAEGLLHPGWTLSFLRAEPIRFENVVGSSVGDGSDPIGLADYTMRQFDRSLAWRDVDWLRSVWPRALVLKGIQTVEDAVLAADAGVEAIILSNHGGRQLDDAPAPITLVGPVADAVAGRVEIICDGGVRRGSDIVKAISLGASACMVGRAYLYGLGAAGERGVSHVLELFRSDLTRTMALIGASATDELDRAFLELAGDRTAAS
jgi:L-lactate dehydrogenase (cytochrome)